MLYVYTFANFVTLIVLYVFIYTIFKNTPYLYAQILNVYAFSLIFFSVSVLEYGFYITESFNYSFFNGAAFSFLFFLFFFYFFLKIFIDKLSLVLNLKQKNIKLSQKKHLANFLLFFVQICLLLLVVNLLLSPIPLFSNSITRFNFWEHSFYPKLGSVFGETSVPVVIVLGVLYSFYESTNKRYFRKVTAFTFLIYIVYLFLLGHKFSAQILALFFFYLPLMLRKKPPIEFLIKIILFIIFMGMSYVLYVYSKIDTGIVLDNAGALGGVLYRIFVLQGHVFWNMFNNFDMLGNAAYDNMIWFLNNDLYGLELAMHVISPGFAENYLAQGLRFTAGFPAFLFGMPLWFSVIFLLVVILLYAIILVRAVKMTQTKSIFRQSIYIFMLYFFHFGIGMGDFRFLYSAKFLLALFLLIIIEMTLFASNSKLLIPLKSKSHLIRSSLFAYSR